jgi:DEAD/DEAH box helicase domain-containing protein
MLVRVITFDLEIKEHPDSCMGGWEGVRRGEAGVSCVAVHDSAIDRTFIYNEHDLEECVGHLNDADMLCSFNGREFDVPILQSITGADILSNHYDILQEIWRALPNRTKGYKLDDICKRLGVGEKNSNGASAIELYRDGDFRTLYSYCRNDVALTRKVARFIDANGYIISPDGEYLQLPRIEV